MRNRWTRTRFRTLALGLLVAAVAQAQDSPRTTRLQGLALLGRNRPVAGVTVTVGDKQDSSRLYLTSSDLDGRFQVDGLDDGVYRVDVRRDGLDPVVKDNVGVRFPFRAVVEVELQAVGSSGETPATGSAAGTVPADDDGVHVTGTVIDREGAALSDVALKLTRIDGGTDPKRVRAGDEGTFELDLSAGRWNVKAAVVGFLPIQTELDLHEDTRLSISMVRQPSTYDPSPMELMPVEQPIPPVGVELGPTRSSAID